MNIKFLADVNVERHIVDSLRKENFDVKWIPDFDASMSDEDLLRLANKEKRILITNDKDFGEVVFYQRRISYGIILIRIKGHVVQPKIKLLKKILRDHRTKIPNHFVTITDKKIRITPLED